MKNFFQKIERLETLSDNILSSDFSVKEREKTNTALQIKAFNNIIHECKTEIKETDATHKKNILKRLYNIDISTLMPEEIDDNINSFANKHIRFDEKFDFEEKIVLLKKIIYDLEDIKENLQFKYDNLIFKNRVPLLFKQKKLKLYKNKIEKIEKIKETFHNKLKLFSKHLANHIIENFYTFFIFISFLINTPKVYNNRVLLLTIANILDKYTEIIESAFSEKSLHYKDMIYHYALFEIKELKEKILQGIS